MTHLVGHAMAWGLYKIRQHVGNLPLGNFRSDRQIGLTTLVDYNNGEDLVPVTLYNIHELSLVEFAKACSDRVV
jgi:hypothetical protein